MKKPKRFSPIYVYAAKIEKKGQDFGKATISNLVLVPNAIGFIDFEKPATPIIVVDNSNNNEGIVVTRKKFLEKMNSWGGIGFLARIPSNPSGSPANPSGSHQIESKTLSCSSGH